MSVSGIGTAGYPVAGYGARKLENNMKNDFKANVKEMSSATNVVHIDPDALFSIHHVKTGESANVYKANGSSYHEKADYMSMTYELMNDMKTRGNWDGLLYRGFIS